MSQFRQTPPPRNYLARREQWRLLGLVFALGLAVFLMSEARDPDNWRWFADLDRTGRSTEPETTDIDNLYQPPPKDNEIPDAFIARAEPGEAEVDTTGEYFPGVKPAYLEEVEDNTHFGGIGSAEHLAWLNLLEIVSTTDQEKLEEASTGRATYAQLSKQPNDYRGKLVTVIGTARRANPLDAPKNDLGIEKFRRVWIFPDDNPTSPLVAYVLDLPEGFAMGMEIEADVELTGFFFKEWAYLSGNPKTGEKQLRVAPVLLAKSLTWRKPAPPKPPLPADAATLGTIFGVALLAAVVIIVFALRKTGGRAATAEKLPEAVPPGWEPGPPSEAGTPLDERFGDDSTKQPE